MKPSKGLLTTTLISCQLVSGVGCYSVVTVDAEDLRECEARQIQVHTASPNEQVRELYRWEVLPNGDITAQYQVREGNFVPEPVTIPANDVTLVQYSRLNWVTTSLFVAGTVVGASVVALAIVSAASGGIGVSVGFP